MSESRGYVDPDVRLMLPPRLGGEVRSDIFKPPLEVLAKGQGVTADGRAVVAQAQQLGEVGPHLGAVAIAWPVTVRAGQRRAFAVGHRHAGDLVSVRLAEEDRALVVAPHGGHHRATPPGLERGSARRHRVSSGAAGGARWTSTAHTWRPLP